MVAVEKAFPPCKARVLASDTDNAGNLFSVTHASKGRVHLSAKSDEITLPVPAKGDTVYIESLLPQAVFRMPGRVAECMRSDAVTLIVEQAGDIQRLQRRQYFRLETELPIELTVQLAGKTIHLKIATQDVSAGGFSLALPAPIPLKHEVDAKLHFPGPSGPHCLPGRGPPQPPRHPHQLRPTGSSSSTWTTRMWTN